MRFFLVGVLALVASSLAASARAQLYYEAYIGPETFFYDSSGYICRYVWDPEYGYAYDDQCWYPYQFVLTSYYAYWWTRMSFVPSHYPYWRRGFVRREHPSFRSGRFQPPTQPNRSGPHYRPPSYSPGRQFVPRQQAPSQRYSYPGGRERFSPRRAPQHGNPPPRGNPKKENPGKRKRN